jgi:hypothetical protein
MIVTAVLGGATDKTKCNSFEDFAEYQNYLGRLHPNLIVLVFREKGFQRFYIQPFYFL